MAQEERKNIKGRGASSNTPNRFEKDRYEAEMQEFDVYLEEEKPLLRTQFIKDSSRSIVTENSSPDVGFRFSINPYRGCEHGCAYCYARPTHEYLGYSAGLDFESKILIKNNASELLREKLMSRSWQPETIAISGVTDCYQPIERKLKLTRSCLEALAEFRNPAGIITKNALVTRDLDVLQELNKYEAVVVYLSVTTLDEQLCADLEPRTSRPQARLKAVETLSKAGIPVGVNIAPVIPGLTDHEMPNILKAAADAGAVSAGYTPLRLPLSVSPLFVEWLQVHRPEKKEKVLSHIRSIRGGELNSSQFGSRMRGQGVYAEQLGKMFKLYTKKFGLNQKPIELSTSHFKKPSDQLSFDI
jgi:DNA repair photolyase